MQKTAVTVMMEEEKLKALGYFLRKENTTVQKRMDEALRQLYESAVPEQVREYLDGKAAARDHSRKSPPKKPPAENPVGKEASE